MRSALLHLLVGMLFLGILACGEGKKKETQAKPDEKFEGKKVDPPPALPKDGPPKDKPPPQ